MDQKNTDATNPLIIIAGIFGAGFLLVVGILKGLPVVIAFFMKHVSQKIFYLILGLAKAFTLNYFRASHNEATTKFLESKHLQLIQKRKAFFFEGPFKFEEKFGHVYKVTVKKKNGEMIEIIYSGALASIRVFGGKYKKM